MKNKVWITAACVAALVAYAFWDYKSEIRTEEKKQQTTKIFKLNRDQVSEIRITHGDSKVLLKKDADQWMMLEPVQDLADEQSVKDLINSIDTEQIKDEVEGELTAETSTAFGFDAPVGTLEVLDNVGNSLKVVVGTRKNFEGDSFVKINEDQKIYISSNLWPGHVEKTAYNMRDKKIFRGQLSEIQSLELGVGSSTLKIKSEQATWIAEAHKDKKLDQNKVREMIRSISQLQAQEFMSSGQPTAHQVQQLGLIKPVYRIKFLLNDNKNWTADFFVSKDNINSVKVSEPEQLVKVLPADRDKFKDWSLDHFRDRKEPFEKVNIADVKKMKLHTGNKDYNFELVNDQWAWLNPEEGYKFDAEKIKDMLGKLRNAELATFTDRAAVPEMKPVSHYIELLDADDTVAFKIEFGDLKKITHAGVAIDVVFARTASFPNVFTLKKFDFEDLSLNQIISKEDAPSSEVTL